MKSSFRQKIIHYFLEILVIMISILAAFSLDRWNENNKKSKLESEVLTQIYYDLDENLADLKNDLSVHKAALNGHILMDTFLYSEMPYHDSLMFAFYWIKEEEYIFPQTSGYDNLKALGIDILKNKTLRKGISLVYTHHFPRLTKNNTLYPDISDYLTPFYSKHFISNHSLEPKYEFAYSDNDTITFPLHMGFEGKQVTKYIGYIPKDVGILKTNEEFKFLMAEAQKFRIYKVAMYFNCLNDLKQVLELIEKELSERNIEL